MVATESVAMLGTTGRVDHSRGRVSLRGASPLVRRVMVVSAMVIACLGLGVSPTFAGGYGGPPTTVSVSAASVAVGSSVDVFGSGFAPRSQVTAVVLSGGTAIAEETAVAGGDGEVTFTFKLTVAGEHQVVLTGRNSAGERVTATSAVTALAIGEPTTAPDQPIVDGDSDGDGDGNGDGAGSASGDDEGTAAEDDGDSLARTGGSLAPLFLGLFLLILGAGTVAFTVARRNHS
jgi:hypothetical protein